MPHDRFLLLFHRLRIFSPAGLDRPAALSASYGHRHRLTQPRKTWCPASTGRPLIRDNNDSSEAHTNRGPCGLVPQQCSRQGDEELAEEYLTPTQRVVTTLLTLLPLAVYHVFLDNLFASIKHFKALRSSQVGATGTCRKDSGVDELLVAEKDREGKGIPWGQMHWIPTKDGKVNQFSWKDNALVLFLITAFREGNQVIRSRRWPAGSSAANRVAREVFGSEVRKDLRVPSGIDEYNHHTNGVDTGDQLRSYNQYSWPIGRRGWQSIAWNFLLKVIFVNSFLLQIWGEPEWKYKHGDLPGHEESQIKGMIGFHGKSIVEGSTALTPLA
ncbi:Fatty acid hydroxylase vlmA [Fusarium oxysporum f. sp. albedinis]|nr:Fatty acid hydroxylase vlmA [Fusarium oxysporum f. sp. albedinis]